MYTHTCLQNCTGQAHHALVPAIIQSPTPEQRMPHACSEEVVFTTISSSATSFYSVASSYSLQEITSLSRQGAVNTRFRADLPQRNSSRPRCARENKPPRDRGFGCPPKTRSPGGWVFRGIVAVQRSQVSRSFKACVRRDHSASRDVECTPAACSVAAMPRSQELTCVSVLVSESPNIQDEDWDDEDTEDVDDDYDRQWAPACTQSL